MPENESTKQTPADIDIVDIIVQMYLQDIDTKVKDPEAYYADKDRQDLLEAFFKATGLRLTGQLRNFFLIFCDGIDAGLRLNDALNEAG